jgi:hypothetical protein
VAVAHAPGCERKGVLCRGFGGIELEGLPHPDDQGAFGVAVFLRLGPAGIPVTRLWEVVMRTGIPLPLYRRYSSFPRG